MADTPQDIFETRKRIAALARNNSAIFAEFVLRDETTGAMIRTEEFQRAWHEACDEHDKVIIKAAIELGKALAIDTEVPTPGGWRTMGDLQPGDVVFAGDGSPTTVKWVSPVHIDRECYRVTLRDGSSIVADAEHQWAAYRLKSRKNRSDDPVVVTTRDLLKTLKTRKQWTWRLPVAGPIQRPPKVFDVDPYLLGVWLGDGDCQGPQFTCHVDDSAIVERCIEIEGGIHGVIQVNNNCFRVGIGVSTKTKRRDSALSRRLSRLGVINNKHIPTAYLDASIEQRLDLLRGLMDTDGSVSHQGLVEITQVNERLANNILELVRSLGMKPVMGPKVVNGKTYWRICWSPTEQVFWLRRKADALEPHLRRERSAWLKQRTVVAVEPVASVPVKCIGVDHPDHTFVAGREHIVTHNSQQLTIARAVWELGRNPDRCRVLVVSSKSGIAEKFLGSIKELIEHSPEVRLVFPELRRGTLWRTDRIRVARSKRAMVGPKDPSVETAGVDTEVLGARYTHIFIDDLLTFSNTWTDFQRTKTLDWLGTVFGRLAAGGKIIFCCNVWNKEDAAHVLGKRKGWHSITSTALDWPERWPEERRIEFEETFGKTTAERQLYCRLPVSEGNIFREEYITTACRAGAGKKLQRSTMGLDLHPDEFTATGVDLAISKDRRRDHTAYFQWFVQRSSEDGKQGRLRLKWVERAKGALGPEIKKHIAIIHEINDPCVTVVETNGFQRLINDDLMVDRPDLKVHGFDTSGTSKWSPEIGLTALAAEFERGMVEIPCERTIRHTKDGDVEEFEFEPGVQEFLAELLGCNPDDHVPDRVMAAMFARHAARYHRPFKHAWGVSYLKEGENEPRLARDDKPLTTLAEGTPERLAWDLIVGSGPPDPEDEDVDRIVAERFGFEWSPPEPEEEVAEMPDLNVFHHIPVKKRVVPSIVVPLVIALSPKAKEFVERRPKARMTISRLGNQVVIEAGTARLQVRPSPEELKALTWEFGETFNKIRVVEDSRAE